ncbi:hypothetical protein [Trichocoleus desertorum]
MSQVVEARPMPKLQSCYIGARELEPWEQETWCSHGLLQIWS